MRKAILITGTDTEVGKTLITGLLGKFFLDKGLDVISQKWIQTGNKGLAEDISTHLKLMQLSKKHLKGYEEAIAPYVFKFPSSPHLASKLEKKKINKRRIKKAFEVLKNDFEFVLVEGSGGALVPFDNKNLIIDIAEELKLPVLVVVGNKLGAINHTLLTIEALRKRKMNITGLIFNNLSGGNNIILKDNQKIIKKLTNERILGSLLWSKNKKVLHKKFVPIGEKIIKRLK